jgi:hypothetical protein
VVEEKTIWSCKNGLSVSKIGERGKKRAGRLLRGSAAWTSFPIRSNPTFSYVTFTIVNGIPDCLYPNIGKALPITLG